ncbi:hypothetical protein PQX77_015927 [Marasmius sp. AFHP31]|nr:hypothetical protein PQX77_015927 [Marasmius sp. AFHP31]
MVPESHFTRVLHTNYVPSAKELNEIRHLVTEPQERIRKLDEEIASLQAQRDELQRFVNGHFALMAPFRRFPADIWGEIFAHCLPTNNLNVAVCTDKEAPLLLTTICRAWREIALNTPRLWSSVHISVSDTPPSMKSDQLFPEREEAYLQGIKLWLDRSGSRPLALSIHMVDNVSPEMSPEMSPGEADDEPTICSKLMDLLVGYSRRWRKLSFSFGMKASHQRALDRLVADDVPLLETVHTGDVSLFTNSNDFFHGIPPPNALPQAPELRPTPASSFLCKLSSLRSLHLYQGSMSSLHIPLDWARLTEFSFDYRPMTFDSSPSPLAVLQTIAQTCRSLAILNFRSYLPSAGAHLGPVNWSTLRELRLILDGQFGDYSNHDQDPDYDGPVPFLPHVKDIYSSIIAPQLRRLVLQLGRRHHGGLVADNDLPFHTLIKGAPHLTHLQIIGYHILGAEAFSQCLQAAPSLTTLILQPEWSPSPGHGFRSRRPSYQAMAPPTDWVAKLLSSFNELDSCPQLQVFNCGRCRPEDVPSILEFIQADSRLSRMKQLRADMGGLWGQEVHMMTSPSLIETLRSLRTTHGILVDMKWREAEPTPESQWQIHPYYGLPVLALDTWEGANDW